LEEKPAKERELKGERRAWSGWWAKNTHLMGNSVFKPCRTNLAMD